MDEASASSALSQNQKLFLQHQQHQRQQQQQQQQQMLLLQQFQKQQLQLQQQQQFKHMHQIQQQQAMSRFPSNIDAHLRPPGIRTLQQPKPPPGQQGMPPQQASQQQKATPSSTVAGAAVPAGTVGRQASQAELELAQQDAWMVCNPDIRRPFVSIEDAVQRLLPYHIVADYEAEEDDRILDSDTTGQVPSRLQQWDNNVLAKLAEFTSTFEKQVLAFNIMSRKRSLGEFRSEERLMIEQALLQEEKQSLTLWRAQLESREKAEREAAEIKKRMAMAQVEQARAEASARGPIRASEGSSGDLGEDPGANADEVIPAWGSISNQRDEEPSEDYLNDENDPENDDAGVQGEWREVGELDLNTR